MQSKYYQESGSFSYTKIAIALLLILIGTMILGYIYAIVNYYNPIIYLSVLATLGFGIALLFLTKIVARLSEIRSKKILIILSIFAIIFATYTQWSAYIQSLFLERSPSPLEFISFLPWIFDPKEIFEIIGIIYREGSWSLGILTSLPVTGALLAFIWVAEIGLTAFPTFQFLMDYLPIPYSEQFNKWYPKYTLSPDFESIYSGSHLESKFDTDVLSAIADLGEGDGIKHSKIHLYYLEEESNQYLTVEKVQIEDRGKGKTNSAIIISNYRIDNATASEIQSRYEVTREKLAI